MTGSVLRLVRWEFWPSWAAYLPLLPYLCYLAIRHRSWSLFTVANPGMPAGGVKGESKSEILQHLSRVPDLVAPHVLLPSGATFQADSFPLVLKPNVGERGLGVAILRSQREVDAYLKAAEGETIVQTYVPGCEFGVYYVRYPDEPQGKVLYITEKRFPSVTGDGRKTLKRLILDDSRAVCMASAYFRVAKRGLDEVPALGEEVQLVEIGSHCRGAVFLDASHRITEELTRAIDRVSQAHPGFHLGRYDVRADSVDSLQRGQFQVIELNGVSAEATHVYDPALSIFEAYRVLGLHWRMAFEIGAIHRSRGASPWQLKPLLRLMFPERKAQEPLSMGPTTGSSERCITKTTAEQTKTTRASANNSP